MFSYNDYYSLIECPLFKSVCTIVSFFFGIKSTKQDSYLICFEVVLGASQVILIASSNLCTTMEQLVHKTYVQIDNSILQLNNIHRCNVSNLYYIPQQAARGHAFHTRVTGC